MKKLACRYAVVQFVPYSETGEFVNAGVVLVCPQTGYFDFRLQTRKYARVTAFFDELAPKVYLTAIKVIQGESVLKLYQFNTKTAKHYFCSHCGIYTHHQRRSNPNQYGYNVGCLDGVNPFDLGSVSTNDGVNHPADRKA